MHATSRGDACRSRILHHVDVCGALTDWPTTAAEALESCARPQVSVAAGDRPGALGRHACRPATPGSSAKPANDAEVAAREDALFRLLVIADAYPPLRAGAGVFLDQSDPFRFGLARSRTESPPTSSPPRVATTTNRTRGRGWTTPGSPKTAASGRPRRPSPPPRRRCATRAGSSGSPPARPRERLRRTGQG
jgi:hypothetical protein